jgi:hypothetical protein
MTNPIPEGRHTVTPRLIVNGGAGTLDFYERAFGATDIVRMPSPNGQALMHAGRMTKRMAAKPPPPPPKRTGKLMPGAKAKPRARSKSPKGGRKRKR